MLKILVSNGVDVNAKNKLGEMAIHVACKESVPKTIVEYLLKNGSRVNVVDGWMQSTPLHLAAAAYTGNVENIRTLLWYGADPSMKEVTGKTPYECTPKCFQISREIFKLHQKPGGTMRPPH